MKKTITAILCALALVACSATADDETFNPDTNAESTLDELNTQKDNGVFGATELELGDETQGNAGGTAVTIYSIELDDLDEIRITASRESGDLNPAAYLYFGTDRSVRPDSYDASSTEVTLNYEITRSGLYYLVVRPYRGRGDGEFNLKIECTGGRCAGGIGTRNELGVAGACIVSARDCALRELPSYGGALGEARAERLWADCLEEAADSLMADCEDACDVDPDATTTCNNFVANLPDLADQSGSCLAEYAACFEGCEEVDPFGLDVDEFQYTAAYACLEGYNGNCNNFIQGHILCESLVITDDPDYSIAETGANRCVAFCEATEGAWDEGPWDGCMDECYEECEGATSACNEFCVDLGVSDVDDCVQTCLVEDYNSICLEIL